MAGENFTVVMYVPVSLTTGTIKYSNMEKLL